MAAPGGPDEETWNKMSPREKKSYWVVVVAFWLIFIGVLLYKFLR